MVLEACSSAAASGSYGTGGVVCLVHLRDGYRMDDPAFAGWSTVFVSWVVRLSFGWSGGAGLSGLTGDRRGFRRSGPLGRLADGEFGTTVFQVWQPGFVWVTARIG